MKSKPHKIPVMSGEATIYTAGHPPIHGYVEIVIDTTSRTSRLVDEFDRMTRRGWKLDLVEWRYVKTQKSI